MDINDSVIDTGVPLEEADLENGGEDFDVAVDETSTSNLRFAERLRERADELSRGQYQSIPKFNYVYTDTDSFAAELEEWFCYDDSGIFVECKEIYQSQNDDNKAQLICNSIATIQSKVHETRYPALQVLAYLAMGSYGDASDHKQHLSNIKDNCWDLWKLGALPALYTHIQFCVDARLPENLSDMLEATNLDSSAFLYKELYLCLTILYFMIESLRSDTEFSSELASLNPSILSYLVKSIGRLRWGITNECLPLQHLVLMFWKCLLCLFGDHHTLLKVKKYLRSCYRLPDDDCAGVQGNGTANGNTNDKANGNHNNSLTTSSNDSTSNPTIITASPLEYHAFRQDLISRYPAYIPPASPLPQKLENAQSISHFVQVARPSHTHASNAALPPPTVHIATPAPSPPSSPAIAAGQKVRKSVFMTNQSFPFLFPSSSTEEVPQSIIEAGELFSSRVRTTPDILQLWNERELFMRQERGWSVNDNSMILKTRDCLEQTILDRIEKFYADVYTHLNSFVIVLLKALLANIPFGSTNQCKYDFVSLVLSTLTS